MGGDAIRERVNRAVDETPCYPAAVMRRLAFVLVTYVALGHTSVLAQPTQPAQPAQAGGGAQSPEDRTREARERYLRGNTIILELT